MMALTTVDLILGTILIIGIIRGKDACPSQCIGFRTQLLENSVANKALVNHTFLSTKNFNRFQDCFIACARDCRCMSYNFQTRPSNGGSHLCELNSADSAIDPIALKVHPGFSYHDIVPYFFGEQSKQQSCSTQCCETSPCQNGGKCHVLCGQKKRLLCNCTAGFTGELCTIKTFKSCLDHFRYNQSAAPGFYKIQDGGGALFTVFCDFDAPAKFAWTLVMSYTFANNDQFKAHPLYKDHPVAENLPNWAAYRLSKARMLSIHSQSSHWRATCNYNTDGVVTTDYVRSSLTSVDPITQEVSRCKEMEYVNIRGKGCSGCTIWCHQEDEYTFRLRNWYGEFGVTAAHEKCSFVNAANVINHEQSFGYYSGPNQSHRCASSQSSTTQYWIGSALF